MDLIQCCNSVPLPPFSVLFFPPASIVVIDYSNVYIFASLCQGLAYYSLLAKSSQVLDPYGL